MLYNIKDIFNPSMNLIMAMMLLWTESYGGGVSEWLFSSFISREQSRSDTLDSHSFLSLMELTSIRCHLFLMIAACDFLNIWLQPQSLKYFFNLIYTFCCAIIYFVWRTGKHAFIFIYRHTGIALTVCNEQFAHHFGLN